MPTSAIAPAAVAIRPPSSTTAELSQFVLLSFRSRVNIRNQSNVVGVVGLIVKVALGWIKTSNNYSKICGMWTVEKKSCHPTPPRTPHYYTI